MTGTAQRGGTSNRFSRAPPFLLPGLLLVILIFAFNYWRASRLNDELLERLNFGQRQLESEKRKYDEKTKAAEILKEEVNKLQKNLQSANNEKKLMEHQLSERDEHTEELNDQIQELERSSSQTQSNAEKKIADLNLTMGALEKEKTDMLQLISLQLGREGLQQLEDKVDLGGFQQPSSDVKPRCRESCEAEAAVHCRQQIDEAVKQEQAATQLKVNDIIDSPNKNPLEGLGRDQFNSNNNNGLVPANQPTGPLGMLKPGNQGVGGSPVETRNADDIQPPQLGEPGNAGQAVKQGHLIQAGASGESQLVGQVQEGLEGQGREDQGHEGQGSESQAGDQVEGNPIGADIQVPTQIENREDGEPGRQAEAVNPVEGGTDAAVGNSEQSAVVPAGQPGTLDKEGADTENDGDGDVNNSASRDDAAGNAAGKQDGTDERFGFNPKDKEESYEKEDDERFTFEATVETTAIDYGK